MRGPFTRQGWVNAHDSKYTGEEPVWGDADELSFEDFNNRLNSMYYFYGYYLSKKDMVRDFTNWMKSHGYNREQILKIKGNLDHISATAMKLARAMNLGMPEIHSSNEGTNFAKFVRSRIADALNKIPAQVTSEKTPETKKETSKPNPQLFLRDKVNREIIFHLEPLIDEFASSENTIRPNFDISKLLKSANAKPAHLPFVRAWLEKHLLELTTARDVPESDEREGWSFISKRGWNCRIRILENAINAVNAYGEKIKPAKTKRPRKAKIKTPADQTKHINYLAEDTAIGIKSRPPETIIGAMKLILFNSKYSVVNVLHAANREGFSVKGQSIINLNAGESFSFKLKNPKGDIKHAKTGDQRKIGKKIAKVKFKSPIEKFRMNANWVIVA